MSPCSLYVAAIKGEQLQVVSHVLLLYFTMQMRKNVSQKTEKGTIHRTLMKTTEDTVQMYVYGYTLKFTAAKFKRHIKHQHNIYFKKKYNMRKIINKLLT